MKTILMGDIHGHDSWKQIISQEQDADRFIFVGDYFDSFTIPGATQIQNFQDIIEFKETGGKSVILLIGNHDYHYLPELEKTEHQAIKLEWPQVLVTLLTTIETIYKWLINLMIY